MYPHRVEKSQGVPSPPGPGTSLECCVKLTSATSDARQEAEFAGTPGAGRASVGTSTTRVCGSKEPTRPLRKLPVTTMPLKANAATQTKERTPARRTKDGTSKVSPGPLTDLSESTRPPQDIHALTPPKKEFNPYGSKKDRHLQSLRRLSRRLPFTCVTAARVWCGTKTLSSKDRTSTRVPRCVPDSDESASFPPPRLITGVSDTPGLSTYERETGERLLRTTGDRGHQCVWGTETPDTGTPGPSTRADPSLRLVVQTRPEVTFLLTDAV